MELCWIESWPEVVKYPEVDAKRILVQILSATAFFRLQGVVHRDLKPEIDDSMYYVAPEVLHRSYSTEADIANPNFEDLPWPSPTGKDFVKRLLNKDHRKRMTAAQALAHLWLRDGNPGLLLDFSVYKLVRYYIRASPFRRSALKALSKAIPDEELVFLKAQFMLLDPKDGGLSLNSFTTVSVFLI
ncbi:CDPK-related kinase 4-like [Brassica napus]|uniref:CDPK-related kinase 4-like n=1 Tax=Brassica napus TaxID=3708 RepID=UPI0006AA83BA|nr:CDPK-related kinase 4-like [Brassica napus]